MLSSVRSSLRSSVLLVALAFVLAACTTPFDGPIARSASTSSVIPQVPSEPSVLDVGTNERALTWGGRIRMYRVYRPAGLAPLAPVVVMLHGGLGSSRSAEAAYGWDAVAEREGVLVVYPEATGGNWNVGAGCCGLAGESSVDDVGFVEAVVAAVRTQWSIDPHRISVAGMSSGGMLAYRLACETTTFAAVGAVAATQLGPCVNPGPISVLHVHGTADTTVPYSGVAGSGIAEIIGPPVVTLHNTWREVDRCGGDVLRTEGTLTFATAECPSDRTVALVTIEGGGHQWPGVVERGPLDASPSPVTAPTATPEVTVGPTVPAPTAYPTTQRLWEFFKVHSR